MATKVLQYLVFGALSVTVPVCATVQVDVNGERFQFDGNPRMNEVLAPVALQQHWYWPASSLYKLDSTEPEQLRQKILQQIAELKQYYQTDEDLVSTLQSIERQVIGWRLAKRILTPVDYDLARIQPQYNPRFDEGHYLLQLKLRPNSIYVFGAVSHASSVTHRGAIPVADYLSAVAVATAADSEQLTLLQTDGTVRTAGTEYWNREHIEAMPGAQLFVPVKTKLFDAQLQQLNKDLPNLATHRVLP